MKRTAFSFFRAVMSSSLAVRSLFINHIFLARLDKILSALTLWSFLYSPTRPVSLFERFWTGEGEEGGGLSHSILYICLWARDGRIGQFSYKPDSCLSVFATGS